MESKLSARDRIFQAALERIKHYGYGKTTMAEIAADCGMSPGNIYRFFEAKIDIAEAIARHHYAEQFARLAAIARKQEAPADQRLKDVLSAKMHENFQLLAMDPKVLEMAEIVQRERPLLANEQLAHERVFLMQILTDGVAAGLFDVPDPDFTAEMIQVATMKFSFPQLFSKLPLPRLDREFQGVMNLILKGIVQRAPASAPPEI